jgi:hypothetical protein
MEMDALDFVRNSFVHCGKYATREMKGAASWHTFAA